MMKKVCLLILAGVLCASQSLAQGTSPLQWEQTIPMPGVRGRIDHFGLDLQGRRLFMSALGNDTVEVFNLRAGKRVRTIHGLREPQGVVYVPESNRLFVANGADGVCRIFDGTRFTLLREVRFSSDADNVRYDPAGKRVFVGYGDSGSAGLGILDAASGKLLGTIKLPDHPESFQLERSGPRIFINIPSAGHIIAVADRTKRAVVATWRIEGAGANFPMALDETHHRLLVTCRRPAEMIAIDTASGRIVARVPCVGDADDMYYDSSRKRIYISGGEGFISVLKQTSPNQYDPIARIATAPGARTSSFVPILDRLYLAVPRRTDHPAELRVYDVEP